MSILFSLKKTLVISLILSLGTLSSARAAELADKLKAQVKASVIPASDVGLTLALASPGNLSVLFDHQGEKPFIPASVSKVIPAAASLKILGPSKRFVTEILASAPVQGEVLKGDIYLKGGGDPAFVTETLWLLVNEFARSGIKKIEGSLVVDDTLFDEVRFDPSREDSRVDRAYDAPISAMSFNWNSVNVYVRPGLKVGDSAQASADPENEMLVVENRVKTIAANKKTSLAVHRKSLSEGKEKIIVTGQIALGSQEKVFYKNVTHPSLWSGANLKATLRTRGIDVIGAVKRGKTPEGAKLYADVESKTLSQIVQNMMKFSNNFVAEMLTKHLALTKGVQQGRMKEGMSVLQTYVNSAGIKSDRFTLVNPSGLTRENIFRSKDMVQILAFIQNDFLIQPETLAAFPLVGLDGTLKSRIKSHPGKVRGKTGMLTGVASLAGWVESKKGPLAFAFFYNGKASHTESARHLSDQLLKTIIENE